MKLISHRGNVEGRMESIENSPLYVDLAISKGYDVEIDVWHKENELWLGHDNPEYKIDFNWIQDRANKLWIHCKNTDAIIFFKESEYCLNYFWHQKDDIALTSLNYIWAYPGKQPIKNSIAVMPEINNDDTSMCIGICSDFIKNYK